MITQRHSYKADPLEMVWLESGYQLKDMGGRQAVQYVQFDQLNHSLFGAVVMKPARLKGREISFIRRRLDLSQQTLGSMLSVTEQTISLWERGSHRIDGATDTLLRLFAITLRPSPAARRVTRKLMSELPSLSASLGEFMYIGTFDRTWHFRLEQVRSYASAAARDQEFTISTWNAEAIQVRSFASSRATKGVIAQQNTPVRHAIFQAHTIPLSFASVASEDLIPVP